MSMKMQLGTLAQVLLCVVFFRGIWHTYSENRRPLMNTVSDANLIYEFLLSGLVIDEDNNVKMWDKEMTSMRQGQAFLNLINDGIPKTVPEMEKQLIRHAEEEQTFSQEKFEIFILGMIYSAYQVREKRQESQQQAWAGVLGRLANITLVQLRKS